MILPDIKEIKNRRENLGLTQQELAKKIGKSRITITRIETGKLDPKYSIAKQLFETLDDLHTQRSTSERTRNLTLKDIHNTPVETVEASKSLHDVRTHMIETNFDQFPVESKGRIIGSITDRTITKAIYDEKIRTLDNQPIETIMEEPFPILSENTPLSAIGHLMMTTQAILTQRKGKVVGIITNSDIGKVLHKL